MEVSEVTKKLLTVEEVAGENWLRRKPAWVIAHANGSRKPVLPSVPIGRFRMFTPEAVQQFILDQQEVARKKLEAKDKKRRAAN